MNKYIAPVGVQAKPYPKTDAKFVQGPGKSIPKVSIMQKIRRVGGNILDGLIDGQSVNYLGQKRGTPVSQENYDSYKKGGKVKKTGFALVHKGELVLNKKQQGKLKSKLKSKLKKKIKKTK